MPSSQNYINHIALVLDASLSMVRKQEQVIQVADAQIKYLAKRSLELNQETRITVYVFNDTAKCVIYDKDVLRLPSIRDFYKIGGNTALIDATLLSQADLALTSEKYGDHAFLTYVLTDGEENVSRAHPSTLAQKMHALPDNYTVAVLVPDQRGVFAAKSLGFPPGNIAVWDVNSVDGVQEVGEVIRAATDTYMTQRSSGLRKTSTLFSTSATTVNKGTVTAAKLKPVPKTSYVLLDVADAEPIREWVLAQGEKFIKGACYYQLTKRETIQDYKEIAFYEKSTGRVYAGTLAASRQMLGLPDLETRVSPDFNPLFDVFVQSTSVNRKLVPGTKLLLFK